MTPRDVPPLSILKHSLAQMAAMAEDSRSSYLQTEQNSQYF